MSHHRQKDGNRVAGKKQKAGFGGCGQNATLNQAKGVAKMPHSLNPAGLAEKSLEKAKNAHLWGLTARAKWEYNGLRADDLTQSEARKVNETKERRNCSANLKPRMDKMSTLEKSLAELKKIAAMLSEPKLDALKMMGRVLLDDADTENEDDADADVVTANRPGRRGQENTKPARKQVEDDDAQPKRGRGRPPGTGKNENATKPSSKQTSADAGSMSKSELHTLATDTYHLTEKAVKGKDIKALLSGIDKMAANGKTYAQMLKLAEKVGVTVVQPKGRPPQDEKAKETKMKRVAIVQMINAGKSPLA